MERRAERRLVTCLFVDIVGSTDLTLDLGPERMKRLLDRAFGAIASSITERGGTVEKYVGDAIFALFGAPMAHADDPERALRAADAFVSWTRTRPTHAELRRLGYAGISELLAYRGVRTNRPPARLDV